MDSNVAMCIWFQSQYDCNQEKREKKIRITSLLQLENYRAFAINFLFFFRSSCGKTRTNWPELFRMWNAYTANRLRHATKIVQIKIIFHVDFYPQFVFFFLCFSFVLFGFWNIAIWPEWSWAARTQKCQYGTGHRSARFLIYFFSDHRLRALIELLLDRISISCRDEYANLNRLPFQSESNAGKLHTTIQKKFNFLPAN